VTHRVEESQLTTVRLTAEAEARLGIAHARVVLRPMGGVRALGGEIMAPPGHALTLTAPVAGALRPQGEALVAGGRVRRGEVLLSLVPLAPSDRDVRAQATLGVASAAARLEAAESRALRAARLAQEQAGSVRAAEESQAERDIARAALVAAQARRARINTAPLASDVSLLLRAPYAGVLRQVFVAEGQTVAAGAPLLELVALDALWVRVPVYVGDLATLDAEGPATLSSLSADPTVAPRTLMPVQGPPTADAVTVTRDLYYALAPSTEGLVPGERVMVQLPLRARTSMAVVPDGAIVWDIHGGAWVYEVAGAHTFLRRRVEVHHVAGGEARVSRGLSAGTEVVTVGAAELFGVEFGAGH